MPNAQWRKVSAVLVQASPWHNQGRFVEGLPKGAPMCNATGSWV